MIISIVVLCALASCTLELTPTVIEQVEEGETVLLSFKSDRPQYVPETKTEWSTDMIVWSSTDKIRVGYKLDSDWMGQEGPGSAKFYASGNVSIDPGNASKGTFTVPVNVSNFHDPATAGTYKFFAVYPSTAISVDVADPSSKNITLPSAQTPGAGTFDPRADIMVGHSAAMSLNGLPTDPIALSWDRLVAHLDLTLSNLAYDAGGETVTKITLTFNSEAKVAGTFELNIPTATAGEGSTNVISLSGANITTLASGANAWACVLPVTFTSLHVEVKTDLATYTRNITGFSKTFKKNARNTLTVNMASASRVENTTLIPNGNYVIAALNEGTYYAISSDENGSSGRRNRSEITEPGFDPDNYSSISPFATSDILVWTVTNVAGGVKINLAGETSEYMKYSASQLPLGSEAATFEVADGATAGTFVLTNTGKYIAMNGSYGFASYASGTGKHDLYFIPAVGNYSYGSFTIIRSCFPSGQLAYNETDAWSTTATTGETITGEGDLYSTKAQTTLQTKNTGVTTMYHNTIATPGPITKITLTGAEGTTTRNYTVYVNSSTTITSTTDQTSKGVISAAANTSTSLRLSPTDNWHYFWLNLAVGASTLTSIDIQYLDVAPPPAAVVTTGLTESVGTNGATLLGSYSDAAGTVTRTGFIYGTSSGSLGNDAHTDSNEAAFSEDLIGLSAGTTYYYKAYVVVDDETVYGSERSFTTESAAAYIPAGWLELPAVSGTEDYVGEFYGSGGEEGPYRNYSYYYNYTYYASLWVAYPLSGSHKSGSASTSKWRYNPNISNSYQVKIVSNSYPTMYDADDYARGHQCPNASRKSDDEMNKQTYYSTNQTPQLQDNFNGSIWGSLEGAVRGLVSSASDTVYVCTGPVYQKAGGSETINYLTGAAGKNANPASLPIPNYYWKALLKVKRNGSGAITDAKTIAFWFPHRNYTASEHYYDSSFVVSVDQIETWTGFDLFHKLPDALEETAEANTSWSTFTSF